MAAWLYWPGVSGRSADAASGAGAPSAATPPTPVRAAVRRSVEPVKPFIDRLLEVLVSYVLVGTLGNSLELNLGNGFTQGWEFYAVTLALFVVLAYPGFVWRYMLKARRHH
ncbi:MAG: DUF2818 family protein [Castellaniella sp.]|uniref:DUF2818 family protein n=1 Tax=Castellaniella sp. TaxID=1955812 RepID=UPI00121E51AB|nr:MAG: DUF2818 family protein [Castellaniella sp.]